MNKLVLYLKVIVQRQKNQRRHFHRNILCCAFLLLLATFTEKASATHAAGGYITYEWLYGTTYRFTVTLYKDCAGSTPAPNEMEIDMSSSCGSSSVNAIQLAGTGKEITYPCPGVVTSCDGGTSPGYRKYVYQVIDTFKTVCSDWVISFKPSVADNQVLGRNALITTLYAPVGNMYVQTTMDNVNYPMNDAVTFSNDPILYICAGQQTVFNLGATDLDGDSLSYQLVSAMQSAGVPVNYVYPLTAANPLFPGAGAVSLDSSTGDITINTNVLQVGIIDILVSEYKNGVVVGSVVIDLQVIVQACSSSNPAVTGVNGSSVYMDTVCAGTVISFPVYSSDPGQTVTMTWNNGIPLPATFTITGSPYPTGTFTWPTTVADTSPSPYTFTVTVRDNACPIKGSQTFTFSIYVIGGALSVNPSAPAICSGGTVSLTASGGSFYSWNPSAGLSDTTGATVMANPSTTATYTVTSNGGVGCNNSSIVTVTVNSLPVVNAGPDANICSGASTLISVTGPPPGCIYTWTPSTNLTCGNCQNPTANPSVTTTYIVSVTDTLGCSSADTVTVNVTPLSATAGPDTIVCAGSMVPLTASGGTNYSWTPTTNLTDSTIADPFAIPEVTTTYTVTVSTGNCTATATVDINVHPYLPIPNIKQKGDSLFCTTDPRYVSYQWYDSTTLVPGATDTIFVATHSGNYNVAVYDDNRCSISVGINIVILKTGLQEQWGYAGSAFAIYPNPAGDIITLTGNKNHEKANILLTMYNVLGEKILSGQFIFEHANDQRIDITKFPSGIYFIEVLETMDRQVLKFVKE